MKHLLLVALCVASFGQLFAAEKPNVLVILADDLGYGDVQCYNPERGKIPTPHIDKLAAQGIRFTDGHSSSGVCSPSRYTLLTGRYHWRTRLQSGIVGTFGGPLIAPERLTIGRLAKQHGYRTAAIGKWHLGWNWPIRPAQRPLLEPSKQPLTESSKSSAQATAQAGKQATVSQQSVAAFREVFSQPIADGPTTRGFDSYFGTDVPNWPPFCFIENDRTVGIPSEFLPTQLLRNNQASLQGPALKDWKLEAILPALGDRAVAFIADAAKQPEPFLLYVPLTAPHTPLAVNEEWKGKSGLTAYADFVMETDAVVGRILAALDASGKADNTLVFFTSDNGCAPYVGKQDLEKMGHFPSGPLRGAKSDAWEGGHRVPFIVRWPGKAKPGTVCNQLVHQADLIATVAEILGTTLPDDAGEDSFSLMPLLNGEDKPIREHAISASVRGIPAVRNGSWKYIPAPNSGGWSSGGDPTQSVQLYNLADDIGETRNLAATQPRRVEQMAALLEKLIADGRSTPGAPQANDVEVHRFPETGKLQRRQSIATEAPARGRFEGPAGKPYIYKTSAGKKRRMEIYFPPNHNATKAKVPGMILFHGGGWSGGSLDQFRVACAYFASRGLVCATAEYQMLGKAGANLPEGMSRKRVCVTDAKSAIRWFKQHAGELGIDSHRIITGGGSAGGHISALATMNPGLNDPADPRDIDTSVVAYVWFNPAFAPDDGNDSEIDILSHMKADLPPAIVFFGDRDEWKKGWDTALAKWKELGAKNIDLHVARGQKHGFFNNDPWRTVTLMEADKFLVKHGLLTGEPSLQAPATGEQLFLAP